MTVERTDAMRKALSVWKKFAYYAMGKDGHAPITLPLWHALLFSRAIELTDAIPPPPFSPDMETNDDS